MRGHSGPKERLPPPEREKSAAGQKRHENRQAPGRDPRNRGPTVWRRRRRKTFRESGREQPKEIHKEPDGRQVLLGAKLPNRAHGGPPDRGNGDGGNERRRPGAANPKPLWGAASESASGSIRPARGGFKLQFPLRHVRGWPSCSGLGHTAPSRAVSKTQVTASCSSGPRFPSGAPSPAS